MAASMAASFDLEIIENPPIDLADNFGARFLSCGLCGYV
jgi:hypothetical protein